jgi:hypothetical protein
MFAEFCKISLNSANLPAQISRNFTGISPDCQEIASNGGRVEIFKNFAESWIITMQIFENSEKIYS